MPIYDFHSIYFVKQLIQRPLVMVEFRQYLTAFASNKEKRWLELLDYLVKLSPSFPVQALELILVHDLLYPEQPDYHHKTRRVKDCDRNLAAEIATFFFIKRAKARPLLMAYIMGEVFEELDWDQKFFRMTNKLLKKAPPAEEIEYHQGLAHLNFMVYWHPNGENHYKKEIYSYLIQNDYHVDAAYAIQKFLIACEMLGYKVWKGKKMESNYEENLKRLLLVFEGQRKEPLVDILMSGTEFYLAPNLAKYEVFRSSYFRVFLKKLQSPI